MIERVLLLIALLETTAMPKILGHSTILRTHSHVTNVVSLIIVKVLAIYILISYEFMSFKDSTSKRDLQNPYVNSRVVRYFEHK